MKKYFTLFVMIVLFTGVMWGQIAAWQLNGKLGNEVTVNATTQDANLNISTLSRGSGLNAATLANAFGSTNFTSSGTKVDAISSSKFIQFSLNAKSGYTVSLSTLDVRFRRSSTGPNAFRWQYSTDGSTFTDIGGSDISYTLTTTGGDAQSQINLSGITALQTVPSSTTITIRLLGWGASATTGTFAIGRSLTTGSTDYSLNIGGSVDAAAGGSPTKLVVTSINSGSSPSTNTAFNVTVQSKDNSNVVQNVSANTDITLSLASGSGSVGGTLSGTILAGQNSVIISGVTYNTAESGVSITATRTSGDVLSAGISSTFTVLEAATKLAFVNVPLGGQPNSNISTFTVEAQRSDNTVDLNYTGTITVAKASGSGNISGTLTPFASAGVATFSDVQFDATDTYTISASASGLAGTTSGSINILSTALPLVEIFNYTQGTTLVENGWTALSGTGTNNITVGTTSLSYTNYPGSGTGKSVALANTGQDVNRKFTTTSSGSIYLSFMINVSAASATGDYFFAVSPSTSATSYFARLHIKSSGAGYNLGISKSNETSGGNTYGSTELSFNTTYVCVIKYVFNTGSTADDELDIFVFSDPTLPASEPGTPEIGPYTNAVTDASDLSSITLRQGSTTPTLTIDGIRISTSWSQSPLPVELTSFTGTVKGAGVELAWRTAMEVNNHGFEIERMGLNQWTKIGFVEGNGTTHSPKSYSFVDASAAGTVSYRLKQIDNDGKFEYSNTVEVTIATPAEYALLQNHPNPFNPTTSIRYQVAAPGHVTLKVYDMLGKEVATLVNGVQDAGAKIAQFDASQLPSGIYFYTLRTNTFSATKKMLLVK